MEVISATGIVMLVGLALGIILVICSKVFYVPVNEKIAKLSDAMPGANCGACGFAGCDDYAEKLGNGEETDPSQCPVGGADLTQKLSDILGIDTSPQEKKVAVVMCNGNRDARGVIMEYHGMLSCSAAKHLYGGAAACPHGCLGFGECEAACQFDAIHVCNGVAVVDREKCVSCGKCAKVCPNGLIRMAPIKNTVIVQCSSHDKGKAVMEVCKNGCIGCGKCSRVCKFEAITMDSNVARIDPDLCKNCGLCVKECPTGSIINMKAKRKPAGEAKSAEKAEAKTEVKAEAKEA